MPKIEIVYGDSDQQILLNFDSELGDTVGCILKKYLPELDVDNIAVGIFGTVVDLDYQLKENDRIEIYRPLLIDPKIERRKRGVENSKIKKHKHKNIRNYREVIL